MTGSTLAVVLVGGSIALIFVGLAIAMAVMSQRRSQHISMSSSEDTTDQD